MAEMVYAIMDDGPRKGWVCELKIGDCVLEITDANGTHQYHRHTPGPVNNQIAHFRFDHTKK
jgi:hypothetical protein